MCETFEKRVISNGGPILLSAWSPGPVKNKIYECKPPETRKTDEERMRNFRQHKPKHIKYGS